MTTRVLAAAVPLPDLSFLAGLEPGVAYAALATITIVMTLIYLGPGIRERLRPAPPATPPTADPPAAAPTPPQVTAAVQQADDIADKFIAHLQTQVVDLNRVNADLARENERLRIDLERATWRRGETL